MTTTNHEERPDLETLARSHRPDTTPPLVADLRYLLTRRIRQRRRRAVALTLAGLALCLMAAATVTFGLGRTDRARIDAGPVERGDKSRVSTTTPEPDAVDRDQEPDRTEPEEAGQGSAEDWSILVPTGAWRVSGVSTQTDVWAADHLYLRFSAATLAEGPFGPTVTAHFNPGLETRDYGDGPQRFRERPTSEGTMVRIGTDGPENHLTGIFIVDGGSIAVSSYDLDEADLLAVIDGLSVIDERVVHTGTDLPVGLTTVSLGDSRSVYRTTVSAELGPTELIDVEVRYGLSWEAALLARWSHPDAQPIEFGDLRGIVYEGYGSEDSGAVLLGPERSYEIRAGRWSESSPPMPVEEVIEIVNSLELRAVSELEALLNLPSRAELFDAWLGDTPLPPDHGLAWLADGPATGERFLAEEAHQLFSCAWVGHWVNTGEAAALDAIAADGDWPTVEVFRRTAEEAGLDWDESAPVFVEEADLTAARATTTLEERNRSALRQSCTWYLGRP